MISRYKQENGYFEFLFSREEMLNIKNTLADLKIYYRNEGLYSFAKIAEKYYEAFDEGDTGNISTYFTITEHALKNIIELLYAAMAYYRSQGNHTYGDIVGEYADYLFTEFCKTIPEDD